MGEPLKVFYTAVSPARRVRIDRFQLLSASFCLVLGLGETLKGFSGMLLLIPIFGFIAAVFNIVMVIFYRKLKNRFGDRVEVLFLKANGIIMLITGVGFHFSGSNRIQYAYYILALLYFIILPYFLIPARKKKYIFRLNPTEITFYKPLFKPALYSWQGIESVMVDKNGLQLRTTGKKKFKRYYFQHTNDELGIEIVNQLTKIKSDNDYSFEIQWMQ
jgi:hypothetical protein